MTTIKIHGDDMGSEEMLVKCDLTQASAPVEVDYQAGDGAGWESTIYQCADTQHTTSGLITLAKILAAQAFESAPATFLCEWSHVWDQSDRQVYGDFTDGRTEIIDGP